jgi:hypothetical protein
MEDYGQRGEVINKYKMQIMKRCWLVILLLGAYVSNAQDISTFAGCATCTSIGDGGPATAAIVYDPNAGIFDKYGNYYFTENSIERVRKVDSAGIITTVAGTGTLGSSGDGGPATAARLSQPSGATLDSLGNMYISEVGGNRIRKVDKATGIITTIAGNGTGAFYGDGIPATAAEIWGPQDICIDKKSNLYIADEVNYRVRKINPMGIISTYAGSGGFSATGTGDGGPATAATFNFIFGLAADDTGNIYIADYNGAKVRKVDTFGIITTVAGNGTYTYSGDGIPATAAQIAPIKLAIDSSGELIIADKYNLRIFKVDNAGIIHCIAGNGMATYGGDGGPATAASIYYPSGVSFDPCWNLYIADVNNKRIRKVAFNATCNPYSLDSVATLGVVNNINASIGMTVYPNPATDEITINGNNILSQISIRNMMGQVVYEQKYRTKNLDLNIGNLPNGIYFVEVVDEEGNKTVRKIVKE